MRLRARYKRLTLWNKLSVWGAVASIVAVPLAILLFHWPVAPVAGPTESEVATTLPRSLAHEVVEMPREQEIKRFLAHDKTAGEVYQTVMRSGSIEEREKTVEALFRNRWIPSPGWSGTVVKLPKKVDIPSSKWAWVVLLREQGSELTGPIIHIWTNDDASGLRVGHSLTVIGRIKDVRTGIAVLEDGQIRTPGTIHSE